MTHPSIEINISPTCDRIALCGGPYSNFGAVAAFLDTTAEAEFQQSLLTGVWTTCAEILPAAEKSVRSRLPLTAVS